MGQSDWQLSVVGCLLKGRSGSRRYTVEGRILTHFGPGAVKGEVSRHYNVDGTHEECCTAYLSAFHC
jgi:hypothetical protein